MDPRTPFAVAPTALALLAAALFACRPDDASPKDNPDPTDLPSTSDPSDPTEPPGSPTETEGPTWHADIAPLVAQHCASCHTEGAIAGRVPLDRYERAWPWSAAMAMHVEAKTMPPFPADDGETCENPWGFVYDRRLTEAEIAAFVAWDAAGAPEGIAGSGSSPPPALPPPLDRVDQEIVIDPPFPVPARSEVEDAFVCLVVDPGLTEDGFLEASEVVPDVAEVVHHVVVHANPDRAAADRAGADGAYPCSGGPGVDAFMIGAYVPGAPPLVMPAGSAVRVPAGSLLVVEMHYHGIETSVPDASAVHLQWADGPRTPAIVEIFGTARTAEAGLQPGPGDRGEPEFFIPAGAQAHTERSHFAVEGPPGRAYTVFMAANHMHRIGANMRASIQRADGSQGPCLLETPRWDFDWQLLYNYDALSGNAPVVYGGDELILECTYNNTADHPGTAEALAERGLDAPVDVTYGEGSLDEMCVFVVGCGGMVAGCS